MSTKTFSLLDKHGGELSVETSGNGVGLVLQTPTSYYKFWFDKELDDEDIEDLIGALYRSTSLWWRNREEGKPGVVVFT